MSDSSGPKAAGIPAWQKAAPSDNTPASRPEGSSTPVVQSPQISADAAQAVGLESENQKTALSSSPDLRIDQAKRFLVDETLHNATLEQKKSFLEAKGLSKEDIDEAIKQTQDPTRETAKPQSTYQTSPQPIQTAQPEQQPPALPSRDVPPIITYPEFLVHAQKPPPIITANRLLNTAYIAAGIGAAIYGASKYLITPMTDTLTEARHDFANHVQEQVEALNAKLRTVTSAEPPDPSSSPTTRKTLRFKDPAEENDAASETSSNSDPTELFHRDFGTQTSPTQASRDSRPLSSSSSDASDLFDGRKSASAAEPHTHHLSQLANHITAFTNNDTVAASANAEISTVIRVLNEYLESLAYPAYLSTAAGGHINYSGSGADRGNSKSEDEVTKIKTEIRSVKGVLLSAKNFPASSGGRRSVFPSQPAAGTA